MTDLTFVASKLNEVLMVKNNTLDVDGPPEGMISDGSTIPSQFYDDYRG